LVSPTKEFYNSQLALIHQEAIASVLNSRYQARDLRALMENMFGQTPQVEEEEGELGGEPTSPENEVSTVLLMPWTQTLTNVTSFFLLTADSGTAALTLLKNQSINAGDMLKNLDWMQIPHHGSRRNLNADLIKYFSPKVGYVSAEGSNKHPSKKLVNAIKERGGRVYSTHYPPPKNEGYWIRESCGNVPQLNTIQLPPLWDAKS
jgi:hypothetical protein